MRIVVRMAHVVSRSDRWQETASVQRSEEAYAKHRKCQLAERDKHIAEDRRRQSAERTKQQRERLASRNAEAKRQIVATVTTIQAPPEDEETAKLRRLQAKLRKRHGLTEKPVK